MKNLNIRLKWLAGLALAGLVAVAASGCGKSAESAASDAGKLFASAPPETKATWEAAQTAVKANDYATALLALRRIRLHPGLTPEQVAAVDKTSLAVSDQMYEAANKGDANAKKAIETMRNATAR